MPVSADTLIRQVKRAAHLPALPQVRVLGVDDWAWSKGQTFGTILVDLEHSQVVDLLPTRSADSLGEWLAQHPEVTIDQPRSARSLRRGSRRRTRSSPSCGSPSPGSKPHPSGGT